MLEYEPASAFLAQVKLQDMPVVSGSLITRFFEIADAHHWSKFDITIRLTDTAKKSLMSALSSTAPISIYSVTSWCASLNISVRDFFDFPPYNEVEK
ncbi:hypothetical protein [Lacticaseibacillus mingshuiensis]|uniref:XRE family transcriptional regulator n=1 Tax=Lacticaseibacillus mingshuiensis TaxID=2799574 RepID=A0ABW4CLF9_9LACO|nr:hypothetical protein [Lacticaseibacillus mingshuiensis]